MKSLISGLECSLCGGPRDDRAPANVCPCGGSLLVRYELSSPPDRDEIRRRPRSQWRFFELMPLRGPAEPVSLGEGDTPLLEGPRLAKLLGVRKLWIKDEGVNPTASFKARGLSAAISKACELGIRRIGLPTAGNAGSAAALYGARAGIEVHVFLPKDAPAANVREITAGGARIYPVEGSIADAGTEMARWAEELGLFDVSTLKEPYRVEGKKIMAYEIAETLGWTMPDVLVFPTGGGTGVIGMWKAVGEMLAMGWIRPPAPRIVAVQSGGCAPLVEAFSRGAERCGQAWPNPRTVAAGLRVPRPYADHLVLKAVRDSGGTALAVSDDEILESVELMTRTTGIHASPEGAACVPAVRALAARGAIGPSDSVAIFNTASGLK